MSGKWVGIEEKRASILIFLAAKGRLSKGSPVEERISSGVVGFCFKLQTPNRGGGGCLFISNLYLYCRKDNI